MKQRFVLFSLPILLGCAFLLFTGCPGVVTDDAEGQVIARTLLADPPPVFTKNFILEVGDGPVYFNLVTGAQVPVTGDWDFGVEYQWGEEVLKGSGLVFFYTKSGVSGRGNGAVWYTEVADFDEVVFEDKENVTGTEYAPYVTDVLRYAQGMGYTVYDTPMNIMTYFGFPGGTGTVGDPFQVNPYDPDHANTYKIYSFNKWAAYKEDTGGMPPDFIPTGTVYIIAHHGGLTFSKLQVTDFSLDPDELFYTIGLKFTKVTPAPPARGGGVIGR